MKRYIYIYISIQIKINYQDIYSSNSDFLEPRILFRSSECLQLLRRNYYKNVMHIIQLSHILQCEVAQVFFYSNTYTDCLVVEFPRVPSFLMSYL